MGGDPGKKKRNKDCPGKRRGKTEKEDKGNLVTRMMFCTKTYAPFENRSTRKLQREKVKGKVKKKRKKCGEN